MLSLWGPFFSSWSCQQFFVPLGLLKHRFKLCFHNHKAFSLSVFCLCLFFSYKITSPIGWRSTLTLCDLPLTWLHLQWSYSQIRSHSEIPGLGFQHIFWEHTIQPTIPGAVPQSSSSSQIVREALAPNIGKHTV